MDEKSRLAVFPESCQQGKWSCPVSPSLGRPVVVVVVSLPRYPGFSAGLRFALDQRSRNRSFGNSLSGCLPEDSGTPNVSFCFDLLPNRWQDLGTRETCRVKCRVSFILLKPCPSCSLLPAKSSLLTGSKKSTICSPTGLWMWTQAVLCL